MNTERSFTPIAALLVRFALAASFLSAVADRLGFWGESGTGEVAWGNFETFVAYTGTLLWYLPQPIIVTAAWVATGFEVLLAVGLMLGIATRYVAAASAILLLTFAVSMSFATGVEGPLSFSVWTAASAAALLSTLNTNLMGPQLFSSVNGRLPIQTLQDSKRSRF